VQRISVGRVSARAMRVWGASGNAGWAMGRLGRGG